MVRFDMPVAQTNEVKGKKDVKVKTTGNEKRGFTVALGAFADGTKMRPWVIFKEKNGVLGPRVRKKLVIPDGIVVRASTSGWHQQHLVNEWLQKEPTRVRGRQLGFLDRYVKSPLTRIKKSRGRQLSRWKKDAPYIFGFFKACELLRGVLCYDMYSNMMNFLGVHLYCKSH